MTDRQKEMNKEKKYIKLINESNHKKDILDDKNTLLKTILLIIGISGVFVMLVFFFNRDTDYEKGMGLLNNKNYSEALVEFQKVDPADEEFEIAQSKINYIKGITAFDKGSRSEALMLLAKVDKSDQHYRETQLLIEKINFDKTHVDLETLSQKINLHSGEEMSEMNITETDPEKVNEAEPNSALTNNNSALTEPLYNLISQFEYQYKSAEAPASITKIENLRIMDSLYTYHIHSNLSRKGDAALIEIKRTAESWMRLRIDLVNELIRNNSDETKTIAMIKEEGDKLYSKLLTLLKS
ncbi:MAG TPA: hypothetical protein PKC91_01945 [Ignavibacteria bacterium]|nr:hypothetical protein [Ignavibacteria bacterium]